ncbi:MAG: hypothetical protein GXY55_05505 [Phycisphaerae bacterium]|mgnify:CR=1 FL=1|nr:hypothetical protein [Phycisphaerae bacterium]
MNRVLLTLVISLVAYSGAVADVVVSKGETVHLGLPDGEGPWLRFSLAYLTPNGGGIDPTAAIGAWFDGAGLYDLSNDPHLPGFLDRATNGTMDWMVASLNDQHGHGWNIEYWEGWIWLGQYPDLAPLQITGAQLVVEQVQPSSDGLLTILRMEYLGVPEPASIGLISMAVLLASALPNPHRFNRDS